MALAIFSIIGSPVTSRSISGAREHLVAEARAQAAEVLVLHRDASAQVLRDVLFE